MNTKTNDVVKVDEFKNLDSELAKRTTVSSKIRYLNSKELTRSQIAKKLGKRYQHVRNVLTTPLKSDQVQKAK